MAVAKKAAPAVEIEQKYKDGYVRFKLSNVKVFWAHINKPDTAFGGNKWTVEMRLEDEIATALKSIGFNVNDKKDKEGNDIKNVFKAKKEVATRAGKEQTPPVCVGADGKTPFTDDIGNGSICNLNLSAKAWQIRGEWTLACYIEGIQVVQHEAYSGGFEDVSGDSSGF